MKTCPLFKDCIFIKEKLLNNENLYQIYKSRYCDDNNWQCARFQLAKAIGLHKVPVKLYPNMHQRAEKLVMEEHTP